MGKLDNILDRIIYVREEYGPELKAITKLIGRVYGKDIYRHVKNHLDRKGIKHGDVSGMSLNQIPNGHSSFHVDDDDDHVHHDHN